MILAALPTWVDSAARDLGVIAGLVVALGVIATKTPLGRVLSWMYKRLFGQPVTEWLRRTIQGVIRPEVEALSQRNDDQHGENGVRLDRIEREQAVMKRELEVVSTTVVGHAERLNRGSEAMDAIKGTLDQLQASVAALRSQPPPPPTEGHAA